MWPERRIFELSIFVNDRVRSAAIAQRLCGSLVVTQLKVDKKIRFNSRRKGKVGPCQKLMLKKLKKMIYTKFVIV